MGAAGGRAMDGLRDSRAAALLGMRRPAPALLLGADSAGKTTMAYRLDPGAQCPGTMIGWTWETFEFGGLSWSVFDVCGQVKVRPLYRHFFPVAPRSARVRALALAVDAADPGRLPDVRRELRWLLDEDGLRDAALAVVANKQDLPGALSAEEVARALGLDALGPRWGSPDRVAPPPPAAGAGDGGVVVFVAEAHAAPLCVTVPSGATIWDLREAVEAAGGPPARVQRLSHAGRELPSDGTLADCGVCAEATVDLCVDADALTCRPRRWAVFGTCANSGDGLREAFEWLARAVE